MFFGIIIRMFYNEHGPPHFHTYYQGLEGIFDLEGNLIKGNIEKSKTALKLIKEWAQLHKDELMKNWKRIEEGKPLKKIKLLT